MRQHAVIAGAGEVPYQRRPDDSVTTGGLLAQAMHLALQSAGLTHRDIDGLGVSSHNLRPDRAMDLAWHFGLRRLRWTMDGPPAMHVLRNAVLAVESGDCSAVLIVAGDRVSARSFETYTRDDYNRAHRDHLAGIPLTGPNPLFAILTRAHMQAHGLSRSSYGAVVISQRRWAGRNPHAIYREPLSMDEYLAAPMVSDPLCLFDCVPLVSGADAVIVTPPRPGRGSDVTIRAIRSSINFDNQEGDGLQTGLADAGTRVWDACGYGPDDMDLVSIYDDYPVMVLAQLQDLGFISDGDVQAFIDQRLTPGLLPVNTSGGLLTAGQAGSGGGLHGVVECVRQLRGERGEGQLPKARRAAVAGYGMLPYRYGGFSGVAVLERDA